MRARWVDPVPALKQRVVDELLTLTHGWSQTFAAHFMRLPQSRVSELRRGKLENVSLERLVQCLSRLGRDIAITTRQSSSGYSMHPHWEIDGHEARLARRGRARGGPGSGYPELDNRSTDGDDTQP